ncbi:MAG: lipid biosynthesis B12-binding/radical SAM protein [bacterium]
MKVLLVYCNPSPSPYPVYPLGMSVVARALENAGHTVLQYDLFSKDFDYEHLKETITLEKPGVVGISFRNLDNVNVCAEVHYAQHLRGAVDAIRAVSSAKIVLGGSGFSVMPERLMESSGADYGIRGEAERTIVECVALLEQGKEPASRIMEELNPLNADTMLSPQYSDELLTAYQKGGCVVPVQTKRGCPHQCVYCTYPLLEGYVVRPRKSEDVIADIRNLTEKGVKQIFFTDSIFNDSFGHYKRLVSAMAEQGVCVPWTGFFRPDFIEPEVIQQMKATGLSSVELGSDAASDTTLKAMGKHFDFNTVEEAQKRFIDAGITVSHYFMMGGPGETKETVEEGIENILRLQGAASFIFLGIRILPGTPLEKRALEEGVIQPDTDLFMPVYYFSPAIDKDWLDERLKSAFKKNRHVIYPPNSMDSGLAFLHRLGYAGMSIDMLLRKK